MNKFSILFLGVLLATGSCSQADRPKNQQTKTPTAENKPVDSPKREKTSLEYMREGEAFFEAYDFVNAVEPFQKAFDLEKKERKLDKAQWFALITDLAMVYGFTDDLKRSQEVVDYGIQQEPTYPMFYYIKACSYGEKDDEANAIKYLRLAYQYKANTLKGETLPDPATDNSFKRLMEREKFQKTIVEIKAAK